MFNATKVFMVTNTSESKTMNIILLHFHQCGIMCDSSIDSVMKLCTIRRTNQIEDSHVASPLAQLGHLTLGEKGPARMSAAMSTRTSEIAYPSQSNCALSRSNQNRSLKRWPSAIIIFCQYAECERQLRGPLRGPRGVGHDNITKPASPYAHIYIRMLLVSYTIVETRCQPGTVDMEDTKQQTDASQGHFQ